MAGKFYYERKKKKKKSSSRLSGGLCCCVSFWFWREIGSFFVVAGRFYYDQKKKVLVVCLAGCAAVSVFSSGDYNRKKKFLSSVWRVVLLCQFLVLAITTGIKKSSSCLSGRLCCCVSFWFWREIGSFFVVAGKFNYDRKKSSSRLLGGL